MSIALVSLGIVLSLIVIVAIIAYIIKSVAVSSIDEELEEYEALLRKREQGKVAVRTASTQTESAPVPILSAAEVAVNMPLKTNEEIDKSLDDEELLKDAEDSEENA
ncbi:hypothetical protein WA538_005520 [Blastocystis sp. DL]